jgi:hypothetical protein
LIQRRQTDPPKSLITVFIDNIAAISSVIIKATPHNTPAASSGKTAP